MDRFWRSVSIVMGALLAAGCPVTTKYGIDSTPPDDTDTNRYDVEAPVDLEGAPLPAATVELPVSELAAE